MDKCTGEAGLGEGAEERDAVIVELLTEARLASYLRATRTRSGAMRLYEWNVRVAAGVMELTAAVEVVSRNAMDRELTSWANRRRAGDWLDAAPLDPRGRHDVDKAKERAARGGASGRHDRVLAELSFGFWRYLLSSRYHASLWVPDLHRAFPRGPVDLRSRRREVEGRMHRLHLARNRAAHHEPIHQRDLRRGLDDALDLLGWVHPMAAEWAADVTSLGAVLDARPSG
ncbi:hypothetical protein ACIPEQ_14035 [Curtobacterium sp. NPDC087080]|uniref:hypothetical protein n=1 Tax=Curtobacterium sp. NPDC087080 TaxID=3363965 RepID=UPI0037F6BDBD